MMMVNKIQTFTPLTVCSQAKARLEQMGPAGFGCLDFAEVCVILVNLVVQKGAQRLQWCPFVYVGLDSCTPTQANKVNLITLLANGSDASKQRQWKPQGTL